MDTSEQAKQKWCFAAVASHTNPRAGFGDQDLRWENEQPKTFPCIADKCMAWRWSGWVNTDAEGNMEQPQEIHGPHIMPHGPTQNKTGCVRVGRCGLAGV